MFIREFLESDIPAVKKFTDQEVGQGYYSIEELADKQKRSIYKNKYICSFVLVNSANNEIEGLRLAYPAGNWEHGKGAKLRQDLWPTTLTETAYFQSLFVSGKQQGQGWGPKLSMRSLEIFKQINTRAVVAHCWKESPNNSSFKYLSGLGFKTIIEHPLYWIDIDYVCSGDGYPCKCTAIEMHLMLSDIKI